MPTNVNLTNPPPDTLWIQPASDEDYLKWMDELKAHCPSALLIGANSHGEFYVVQGKIVGLSYAYHPYRSLIHSLSLDGEESSCFKIISIPKPAVMSGFFKATSVP